MDASGAIVTVETVQQIPSAHKPETKLVTEAEISVIAEWLSVRLQERHPMVTREGIGSTLRYACAGRHQFLVRSDRAVALAETYRIPQDPRPVVVEVFARSMRDEKGRVDKAEVLKVSRAVAVWAEKIGASQAWLGIDTDLSMDEFYEITKTVKRKTFGGIKFGPEGATK